MSYLHNIQLFVGSAGFRSAFVSVMMLRMYFFWLRTLARLHIVSNFIDKRKIQLSKYKLCYSIPQRRSRRAEISDTFCHLQRPHFQYIENLWRDSGALNYEASAAPSTFVKVSFFLSHPVADVISRAFLERRTSIFTKRNRYLREIKYAHVYTCAPFCLWSLFLGLEYIMSSFIHSKKCGALKRK